MAVTFMAKPFADTTGSSCHLHLSLVDGTGANVFHDADAADGMSEALRSAVGGVLERAPELMLLYAPTVNSYRRTTSGEFSGNGVSWGFDSRMVSCRVLVRGEPSQRASSGGYPAPTLTRTSRSQPCSPRRPAAWLASADPGEPLTGWDFDAEVPPLPVTLGEAVAAFRDGVVRGRGLRQGRRGPLRRGRPVGMGAVPRARGRDGVGASPLLRGHLTSAATRSTTSRQNPPISAGSSTNCDGLMQIVVNPRAS